MDDLIVKSPGMSRSEDSDRDVLIDHFSPLPHDDPQADGFGGLSSPAPQAEGWGASPVPQAEGFGSPSSEPQEEPHDEASTA